MARLAVTLRGVTYEVEVELSSRPQPEITATINGEPVKLTVPGISGALTEIDYALVNDRPYEIAVDRDLHWIKANSIVFDIAVHDLQTQTRRPASSDGRLKAPIPGRITRILVNVGDQVEIGQPIVMLEAMKMENQILAPRAGVVSGVHVQPGQSVIRNSILAEIS